jgi:hypothetical protein
MAARRFFVPLLFHIVRRIGVPCTPCLARIDRRSEPSLCVTWSGRDAAQYTKMILSHPTLLHNIPDSTQDKLIMRLRLSETHFGAVLSGHRGFAQPLQRRSVHVKNEFSLVSTNLSYAPHQNPMRGY